MREAFQRVFADKAKCFDDDSRRIFFVCDPQTGPAFIIKESRRCKRTPIEVINDLNMQIDFIAVDSCLAPQEQSKCDFILSNNNLLFLIEAKMEMQTPRQENADTVRAGAVGQLMSTINWLKAAFAQSGEAFPPNPRIRLYVCTPETSPRDGAAKKYFREKYGEIHNYYFNDSWFIKVS